MILGENPRAVGTAATLDDLFRRAGVRHPSRSLWPTRRTVKASPRECSAR